jgi:imidazoleglycerol-phosphate dehydratase
MDEALASCSIDLGGRPYHVIDLGLMNPMTEDIANEDITHFMETLATSLRANIHIQVMYGSNDHHRAEAAFKALARCLRMASSIDPRRVDSPSNKGVL